MHYIFFNEQLSLKWGESNYLANKTFIALIKGEKTKAGLGLGISFNIEKKVFSLYHTSLWIQMLDNSLILRQ